MSYKIITSFIFRYLLVGRNIFLLFLIGFLTHVGVYFTSIDYENIFRYDSKQFLPLILLYTHNRSIKTRDNICRGLRVDVHVAAFNNLARNSISANIVANVRPVSRKFLVPFSFIGDKIKTIKRAS